jgi:hypothetical protein
MEDRDEEQSQTQQYDEAGNFGPHKASDECFEQRRQVRKCGCKPGKS